MNAEQIANFPEEFKTDTILTPNLHKILAKEIIALKERVNSLEKDCCGHKACCGNKR